MREGMIALVTSFLFLVEHLELPVYNQSILPLHSN